MTTCERNKRMKAKCFLKLFYFFIQLVFSAYWIH